MTTNLSHKKLIIGFEDAIEVANDFIDETKDLVDIDSVIYTDPVELKTLQKLRTKISQSIQDCNSIKEELFESHNDLINLCNDLSANCKIFKEFKQICANNGVDSLIKSVKTRLRVLQKNKISVNDAITDESERIEKNKGNLANDKRNAVNQGSQLREVLKPVTLQKFDGTPEKFIEFITIFDELVHNDREMSNLKKAIYLKDCLVNSAAMKVSGIPAIGSNYERMYQIIRRKYDNIPVNQNSIVQKLENLEASEYTADSCSKTLDQVVTYLNQIGCSGLNIMNSTDPLWLRLIYKKFPEPIVEKIMSENCREPMFCVENLIDELENAIFTKHFLENNKIGVVRQEKVMTESREGIVTSDNVYHRFENQTARQGNKCTLCNGNHPAKKCLNVTDPEEIIMILKQKRACWKCYELGHSSYNCSEPNCNQCGRNHSVNLCHNRINNDVRSNSAKVNHICENIANFEDSDNKDKEDSYVVQHSVKNGPKYNRVALMTIDAEVYNEESKDYEKVNVFFDNGSQGTFVSEGLIEKLKIPVNSERKISLVGVNGIPEHFISKSVDLKMRTKNEEIVTITAQSKHTLTSGFKAPLLLPYDKVHLQDKNIKIDISKWKGEFIKPDILIGLDNYSKTVLNEKEEALPSGYMLANTIFGKTIYGNCENLDKHDFTGCCIRIIQDKANLDMAKLSIESERNSNTKKAVQFFRSTSKEVPMQPPSLPASSLSNNSQSGPARLIPSRQNTRQEEFLRSMCRTIQSDMKTQFQPP